MYMQSLWSVKEPEESLKRATRASIVRNNYLKYYVYRGYSNSTYGTNGFGIFWVWNFKKREKHPKRIDTFNKFAGWTEASVIHGCFSRFLNCTNGTKLCKPSHMFKTWIRLNKIWASHKCSKYWASTKIYLILVKECAGWKRWSIVKRKQSLKN